MDISGTVVCDGAVYHNNPSGIARQEIARMYDERPDSSVVVSVGCGHSDSHAGEESVLGMLRSAFAWKTSPWNEEAERSLYVEQHPNRFRLDAKLNTEHPIALDNIEAMLQLFRGERLWFADAAVLRGALRSCAWTLIATSFYCDSMQDAEDGSDGVTLSLSCRLGPAVERVWHRYPGACFVVNGVAKAAGTKASSLVAVAASDPASSVHLELSHGSRTAAISGFPTTLRKLQARLGYADTLGPLRGKKRKADFD